MGEVKTEKFYIKVKNEQGKRNKDKKSGEV